MLARGPVAQKWAPRLGIGRRTGIDIPGELPAWSPTPSGPKRAKEVSADAEEGAGLRRARSGAVQVGGIDRTWSGGRRRNLAVGQGDLQATPLQLAIAYSAVIDGGKVVRPHWACSVEDGRGGLLEEIRTPARRRVKVRSRGTATRS